MSAVNVARRAVLTAAASVIALPRLALAQDPRASQVQKAARDWLALADKLDASGTWKAAGSRFRDAIPESRWATLLKRERESRGALQQRAAAATTFASELPALPPGGKYAIVRFRTVFANQPRSSENVTLEQGTDSVWRVDRVRDPLDGD
jgi:hypothetical protein